MLFSTALPQIRCQIAVGVCKVEKKGPAPFLHITRAVGRCSLIDTICISFFFTARSSLYPFLALRGAAEMSEEY